jgi:S1-C subfamily serine protease
MPMPDFEILGRLAAAAAPSEEEVDAARNARDFAEDASGTLEARRLPHPVPELTDAQVCALASDEACLKVIEFEVTSEQVYRRKYELPIAPAGASGITIGIGYDVGWNTPPGVRRDLEGLIPVDDIETLTRACGVRGNEARQRLAEFRRIRVPWEAAVEVFRRATMPRFGRDVLRTFPNAVELKGHCFGALLSLVYNRGSSLDGDSRREMLAIGDLMAERRWSAVPAEFRKMQRLWHGKPGLTGVVKRREAEALLFERGLKLMEAPREAVGGGDGALERRVPADPAAIEGDGYYYKEIDESREALESVDPAWKKVIWPPYEQAPDYSHIPDRSFAGTSFLFGPRELELLIEANGFQPAREHGRIVFALRGAQLLQSLGQSAVVDRQENRAALTLCECKPDHNTLRCVIGVYDIELGRMHGYQSSTVPNPKAVASHVAGGSPSNMMLTGCYQFEVGWHLPSKEDRKIPGCLIENGRHKAVLRTRNDYVYELTDVVHDNTPGDNVHPAKSEGPFPFSSWGCLVLKGSISPSIGGVRETVQHTGEWARFRKMLGLPDQGTGGHGRRFDVILLTGLDAAIAAHALARDLDPGGEVVRKQLYRLRQGSQGWRVAILKRGLGLPAGERFDAGVAAKLAEKQRAAAGKVDAIYSPASDDAFGFGVFSSSGPVAMLERRGAAHEGLADARQLEQDRLAFELGAQFRASRGGARPDSDDVQLEGLGRAILDLGSKALVATGNALIREAELVLRDYACARGSLGRLVDRDGIKQRIDDAAKTGLGHLKHLLVVLLQQASFSFAPQRTLEWLVGFVLDEIVRPHSVGGAVVQRIDGGVKALCDAWGDRIGAVYGDADHAAPGPEPEAPTSPRSSPAPSTEHEEASRLLGMVEREARGDSPNVKGVRHYIRELRDHLREKNITLSPQEAQRFLDILCDSRFMEQIAGAVGRDPYAIMAEIEDALGKPPIDKPTVEARVRSLYDVLGDARLKLDTDRIERTLTALRGGRFTEQVAGLSDRVLTRDSDGALLGRVSPHYGLALIDGQRIVAGIEVLRAALHQGRLTAQSTNEIYGNLGRAYKQVYVNHVRSSSDALALKETLGPQLLRAIECYGRIYDQARPVETHWPGINLVALAKRAERDGIAVASRAAPDDLARALIAALKPGAEAADDHFQLATLGEAYLAVGDVASAAKYYASFAGHAKTDAFALNSAIRQLEEVWCLEAGRAGASSVLLGLKAALAQREDGRIILSATERKAIAGAQSVENQEHFESRTKDGKYMALHYLKSIVFTGMAVAAVKERGAASAEGAGETVGTGFLVDGAEFGLEGGRSYLLTNAHVIWDPKLNPEQGHENMALEPDAAEIVFESGDGDGKPYRCAEVAWQSRSALHDAALVALDRPVAGIKPLGLAPANTQLIPDDGSGKRGTVLAVVGHPEGGPLQIGFSGSLEDINARLVDKGPKASSRDPEYLHYTAPTEPGNSGSPVLETRNWKVVGLHHAGFSESGRPRLGGKAGTNLANEGIWVESIRTAAREARRKTRRGWPGG